MKHRAPIPIRDKPIDLEIVHDNREMDPLDASASDEGTGVGAVVIHHIVTVIIVILILLISVWAYLTFKSSSFFTEIDAESPRLTTWAIDAQIDRVEFALRVYHRLNMKYPTDLDELVTAGLLEPSDPFYPPEPGTEFVYKRVGDSYELKLQTTKTQP